MSDIYILKEKIKEVNNEIDDYRDSLAWLTEPYVKNQLLSKVDNTLDILEYLKY